MTACVLPLPWLTIREGVHWLQDGSTTGNLAASFLHNLVCFALSFNSGTRRVRGNDRLQRLRTVAVKHATDARGEQTVSRLDRGDFHRTGNGSAPDSAYETLSMHRRTPPAYRAPPPARFP